MWIDEFILKRRSQRTNVFIMETFDVKRINQMLSLNFGELLGQSFDVYVYDLQRNQLGQQLIDEKTGRGRISWMDEQDPIGKIDVLLRTKPTIVVIRYIYRKEQADALSDILFFWSQNDDLYTNRSTVIVFTADANLFLPTIQNFCYVIQIPPSSPEERLEILKDSAMQIEEIVQKKYQKKISLSIDESLIKASSGLTLHAVETAALESFNKYKKFTVETFTAMKISILRSYGLEYVTPTRGFESIGGYELLKQYIRNRVIKPLKNPELASKYGVTIPKGILLYGYPGCGKTYFAKALAKEVGLPMIKISPADFLRGIVGETESRVRQITLLIESLAPCIVFIDEIDQLTLSRERQQFVGDSGVSRRMQNMILDWLGDENRKSFLVGATNFVEHIDFAFLRSGRLDETILILLPDQKAREEILKIHSFNKSLDFSKIAEKTYMWTGAELEKLCREASQIAMEANAEKITEQHYFEAMDSFDINVSERERRLKEMVKSMRCLENVNKKFLMQTLREMTSEEGGRLKGIEI